MSASNEPTRQPPDPAPRPDLDRARSSRWIAWAAAAGVLVPAIADLATAGRNGAFRYLASDAFYYFTIARNIATHGAPTFDQAHSTNGYHPLWQWISAAELGIVRAFGLPDAVFLWVAVLSNALFIAGAVLLLARALTPRSGQLSPWFAALPVGGYGVLLAPAWLRYLFTGELAKQGGIEGSQPLFGTLWSYVNGVESGLVLLGFGLCAYLIVRGRWHDSTRGAVALGASLSVLCLARLDHAVFPICFLAWQGVCAARDRDRELAIRTGQVAAPVALTLLAYMAINLATSGAALPISGTIKSSFPQLMSSNADVAWALFDKPGSRMWLARCWRVAQIALPALLSIAFLAWMRRGAARTTRRERDEAALWGSTASGIVLLALYNAAFVSFFQQGHWYVPVSTTAISLGFLFVLGRRTTPPIPAAKTWRFGALAVALSLTAFMGLHRRPDYHATMATFYFDEAPRIEAHYRGVAPRLLSRDDGIVAFALPYPTMSATGLALDHEAIDAFQHRGLLRLALQRGHDRITSLTYLRADELKVGMTTVEILQRLPRSWRAADDYRGIELEVEYKSQDGRFAILRMRPAQK